MPSNNRIEFRIEGAVAHVLLDKPEKLNALDEEMLAEIERRVAECEGNPKVSVLVVGSTSDRALCVGADLEVLSRLDGRTMQAWELLGNRVLDRLQCSHLVSVAVIPGHALGGGLTLAAACEFRIAADKATFAQPEIDLGWIPGWGGVARLARIVGPARAKELCITARRIGAEEARSIGLVDEVVAGDRLPKRVAEFSARLAGRSPAALRAIKKLADALVPPPAPTAPQFDALTNASLLADSRGQTAIAEFRARKAKKNA